MLDRVIAIGDIHGCSAALRSLLEIIRPSKTDTIITLGDYVNRGPDSRGVLSQLVELRSSCTLISLLGNHDDVLLHNRATRTRRPGLPKIDPESGFELFDECHFEFLETCVTYHEIDTHFFVHANYDPDLPLPEQKRYVLMWLHLHDCLPPRHQSGKTAVVGHTSQRSGEVFSRPHLKCIDTRCHGGGWLTAMDVHTEEIWQVDAKGAVRYATE